MYVNFNLFLRTKITTYSKIYSLITFWCLCINVACWWKLNKMLIKTMKNQAKGDRIKRIGTGGWRDTMRGNGQCKRVGINVSASAMQRSKPSRNITTYNAYCAIQIRQSTREIRLLLCQLTNNKISHEITVANHSLCNAHG